MREQLPIVLVEAGDAKMVARRGVDHAAQAVRVALGYPFRVEVVRVSGIARGPTGKFEEFISRLEEMPAGGGSMSTP